MTAAATASFDGLTSRNGPLTWAQRWSWDVLRELEPKENRLNIVIRAQVADGWGVDKVLAVVSDLVGRHETLRTTYHVRPDGDLEQAVHGSGTVPVTVREVAGDPVDEAVDELAMELYRGRFELAVDLPIRVGVVTRGGAAVRLVIVLSNMTVDGWGIYLLERELAARLAGDAAARAPWPGQQPLDQAADERSPAGLRVAAAGTRHWERELARIADITPPGRVPAGERPRYWSAEFTSVALSQAAYLVAEQRRVPPSAVLLAAVSAVLGFHLGQPSCGLFVVVSNRYQPAVRGTVGKLFQSSPLCLDLDGETFGDLVESTSRRLLRASRFGQCDPLQVAPLVHGDGPHRGAHLALPVVYDYHHREEAGADRVVDGIDELRAVAVESTFRWLDTLDDENMRLYVQVHEFDVRARVVFWIDTHYLSRADLAAIVFGTERLLIEATAGEIPLDRLGAVSGLVGR
ncbi:condensation domain-containing protein [Micromonospora sp. DT31]|uniref:condensation domain-containing protein n=1 Tax=Micromonospora sp. DT31 TaxID=3393434 RepID=UPI003CF3D4D0